MIYILLASFWYAWRYSLTEVDPDWAAFNLSGMTGAEYGKDFADCKTPGVHWWYWILAKIVGKDVKRIKFANHFLVSLPGLAICSFTGSVLAGLAYVVLVNSGWLIAFHGNVGQVPASLYALSLSFPNPITSPVFAFVATAFEPKLLVAFLAMAIINKWVLAVPLLVVSGIAVVIIRRIRPDWWESSVIIPKRMMQERTWGLYPFMPWFTAQWIMFLLPWFFFSVLEIRSVTYWLPPVLFMIFQIFGKVIRPNHVIPLAPWIALGMLGTPAIILLLVEALSSGMYFGDIWQRYYFGLRDINISMRKVGEWLRDKPGTLWVNNFHNGAYIYSGKKPVFGMVALVEVWQTAIERQAETKRKISENPPDWIITMDGQGAMNIQSSMHEIAERFGSVVIWKKK